MGKGAKRFAKLLRVYESVAELGSNLPIVELVGEGRVLIEHHLGVVAYSRAEVRIRVSFGSVLIMGNNLKISQMRKVQLIVVGKIDKILLNRR